MKNNRKILIILFSLLLLSGCQNKSNIVNDSAIKPTKSQQVNNANINTVSNNTYELEINQSGLLLLDIVLPENWSLDKSEKVVYNFIDEKGENRGSINAWNYIENFDFLTQMPNHSSITNDEYIDIHLGNCRLITLDSDNGSASSGLTGTHDTYYATVSIKEKATYMLNFTRNDKKPETKKQFIEVLNKLSFK